MKKIIILSLLIGLVSCDKQEITQTENKVAARNSSTSVSDSTRIEMISPFQTEGAIYTNQGWVLNGTLQPWPFRNLPDTITYKFKLHVGNRLVNGGKYKPEKVDTVFIYADGDVVDKFAVPNNDGPGDYIFQGVATVPKKGIWNSNPYLNLSPNYNWDAACVWARSYVYRDVSYNYWFKNIFIASPK